MLLYFRGYLEDVFSSPQEQNVTDSKEERKTDDSTLSDKNEPMPEEIEVISSATEITQDVDNVLNNEGNIFCKNECERNS